MRKAEVCIKAGSPPASLAVIGQVTRHKTVKWPIAQTLPEMCKAML